VIVSVPLSAMDCRTVALCLTHEARRVNSTLGRQQPAAQAAAAAEMVLRLDQLSAVFARAQAGSLLADIPAPAASDPVEER
jgi:hypothetical protein